MGVEETFLLDRRILGSFVPVAVCLLSVSAARRASIVRHNNAQSATKKNQEKHTTLDFFPMTKKGRTHICG
jgi:hypothetical protein